MKANSIYIVSLVFLLAIAVFLISSCTITLPDGREVTIELPQEVQPVEEAPEEPVPEEPAPEEPAPEEPIPVRDPSMAFLIIAILSFIIALVSAIFGFRKEGENTAGKILFTIFIVIFLIMLIFYILSILNMF